MSFTLAIDPGVSTGVAVFQEGVLTHSFTSKAPHTNLRQHLLALGPEDEVVCEKGPQRRRNPETCTDVERLVEATQFVSGGPKLTWVRPTQWKPAPTAVLKEDDSPGTKHEKDATRMGRWHLATA